MDIRKKLIGYLAARDHSEFELKLKLKKNYEPEEINEALEWARENKYLPEPEYISQRLAETLHRKYKGIHYINECLREKGLPTVGRNDEVELEKARHLIKNKASSGKRRQDRHRMIRLLVSRGFDTAIIRKVLHEEL